MTIEMLGNAASRVSYTEEAIKDAFLNLLKCKDYMDITVTDICKTAGVSRGTFYAHFDNIAKLTDTLFEEALSNVGNIPLQYICLPDNSQNDGAVIKANVTFSIGNRPLSAMFAENYRYFGNVRLVDIGHEMKVTEQMECSLYCLEESDVADKIKPRRPFDHKGTFGHALLLAGGKGKAGAAVMASRACLRSGVGLLSVSSSDDICNIMQISVPEAMYIENWDGNGEKFSAIGIGPGIGVGKSSISLVDRTLSGEKLIVVDADAINVIANNRHLVGKLENCILTPHPKEFERLFGKVGNPFERLRVMSDFSQKHKSVVLLKGGITAISLSDGRILFYIGMNPGIATGGSGDVLTGIITSLLAQGYSVDDAAIVGTWIHGEAGKLATAEYGVISTVATDIISKIALVTKRLANIL